ncbi:calcium-activated chloride channel regulator 1-like, partial [Python bivittatus]|uniref:Calcium-activated chloride channel regulator 1-like n=1 Tax=Python bivittatus TaxID=176946 RepID=A0A9F5IIC3_PYTBI
LGDWTYMLHNAYPKAQTLSIIVTSQPASATVPPLNVKPYSSTDNSVFPSPVIIYAELSQGFLPFVGANVIAKIRSSSGTEEIELWDNGSGADVIKHDGIYSRYFTSFKENGKYSIKVCAHRKDKIARQVLRENLALYLPGYIENGTIHMNPPKPTVDKTKLTGGMFNFNRTVVASSVAVTGVPPGGYQDIYPPCRIADLEVLFNLNDEFSLSWTAPGDDYDNGTAESYEMKMSENPLDLQDANFHSALSVNLSDLKPEVAGVKQNFQYKTKNFTKENGTEVFFAIRAIDDSKNVGQVSNIAKAVVLVPSLSKASIVAIICGILMITCILISIAFCSLHNLSSGTPEARNTLDL